MSKAPIGIVIELVKEYFITHPYEELTHHPVVEWVRQQMVEAGYEAPGDVPRTVRKLAENGMLLKVSRGLFKYDPDYDHDVELHDFSEQDKQAILKRDGFKCVVCGLGEKDGVDLAIDHIKPKSKLGTSDLENGQTLCTKHNNMKRTYSRTEAGKKYFIKIYETAVEDQDEEMIAFCQSVFDAYDEHGVNGHIDRPDTEN